MDIIITAFFIFMLTFCVLNFYVSAKAKKELKLRGYVKSQKSTHMRVKPTPGTRLIDILNFKKDEKEYVFIIYAKGWISTKMIMSEPLELDQEDNLIFPQTYEE